MANELKHGDQGPALTKAEFEGVGLHVFNSQATGDIVYASSGSQLSRLGAGSTNDILRITGGLPDWQATSFITSLGTIATGVWQGTDVGVAYGGTGVSALTDGGVLLGSGTGAITAMAVLTDGQMIVGNGTTDPVAESGATLRTSIGIGTGDTLSLTGLALAEGGVINWDNGDMTLTQDGNALTVGGGDFFVANGYGVVIGHTAQITANFLSEFQLLGTGGSDGSAIIGRFSADTSGARLDLLKSRAAIGSHTILADNDVVGDIGFMADDGVDYGTQVAKFTVEVDDGSPAAGDIGAAYVWRNMPGGGGALRETMRIAADGTLLVSVGSVDLNSVGTLLNVGAAGNDWTANALTLKGGSATQVLTVETTSNNENARLQLKTLAAGGAGAGAQIKFTQGSGDGSANNMEYRFLYDNGNGYLVLNSRDTDGSATAADIWRIPDGQTSIDANTTWDDNVFDDYDDAKVLERAFSKPNRLNIYEQGRNLLKVNTDELVEMGVLRQYDDGWIGHNDQRMEALLAGGIYQNRQRMDDQFATVDDRLAAMERALMGGK